MEKQEQASGREEQGKMSKGEASHVGNESSLRPHLRMLSHSPLSIACFASFHTVLNQPSAGV